MNKHPLEERLRAPGPKRILALDGGGVRGILTLGFLERIEQILAHRYGDPDFRLCDYFDLIGGTSTGSIIASGLAIGKPVSELISLYDSMSSGIFRRFSIDRRAGVFFSKYRAAPLRRRLKAQFGDITIGSDEIRTGLAIVSKRIDTGSVWIVHNNPSGKYFDVNEDEDKAFPNKDYLLHQVVRASTAAPTYFDPERFAVEQSKSWLPVAFRKRGEFIDGGVSPHNNPSLILLVMATLEGYGLKWPMGEDALKVVSVGTGTVDNQLTGRGPAIKMGGLAALSMMSDADQLVQLMMQWMGDTNTHWEIDSEVGDLSSDSLSGKKFFKYSRYNVQLNGKWLSESLGETLDDKDIREMSKMDNARKVGQLLELGRKAADRQIEEDDFEGQFDIR